jgi:hypothetical protein
MRALGISPTDIDADRMRKKKTYYQEDHDTSSVFKCLSHLIFYINFNYFY